MSTNRIYLDCIRAIHDFGDLITGRNGAVKRRHDLNILTFHSAPLVTVRKTAWVKAIREMQWFMSGECRCPDELMDWWRPQLNHHGSYIGGYSDQFRHYNRYHSIRNDGYDQIAAVIEGLRQHPYSRRNIVTTWHPQDMAEITRVNDNINTPTCCHSTLIQFFVTDGVLDMTSYQRSADMLLGVPHNWIQSWALLTYIAAWTSLKVGAMRWIFGDAHIYQEDSHVETVRALLGIDSKQIVDKKYNLLYNKKQDEDEIRQFLASDFTIDGDIDPPLVTIRPKLL